MLKRVEEENRQQQATIAAAAVGGVAVLAVAVPLLINMLKPKK